MATPRPEAPRTETSGARLAVIIPHYDDLDRLARCLEALTAQDREGVEIVVADNGTPGPLASVRAAHPSVRFVVQPERGAAAARNAGVAQSAAPWLAFLDCDCVPAPDWLARARSVAGGGDDVVTGGRIDVFDETPPPRTGSEAFETVFAFDQKRYIDRKGFSVTANLVASRAAFEAVGPFRPGLSEDLDWCHRATARGYRLRYDPELAVAHPTRSDWPALRSKWLRLTRETFALTRDRRLGRLVWAGRALAMPLSVFAHVPKLLRCPDLSASERARALGVLIRLRLARMGWMLAQSVGRKGR